ncbi:MAG: ribosome silencing factor [Ruminococcaceae bacterium]|nr:ribosome silencing factor [Oscillospiraceae bacterium]
MSCENNYVNTVVKAIDGKKGKDIQVLDLRELTTLTNYFVIATGGSNKNVQAICDEVEDKMREIGAKMWSKEGYDSGEWILLSYDDVIVHIFQAETREFYKLEHIWKDAPDVDVEDLIQED